MPLSMMKDGSLVPTWTILMKYPDLIPSMNKVVLETLNTLQELIPIRFYRTRLDTFLMWYREGKDAGLVTAQEDHYIQQEMIHGPGGM